ncbi:MAG TPA: hypothetical protein VK775_13250 [Chthoniobacterales bacterium]|jgi:hypothetical protein|nr:hypothetical protein [Chthoniobacterales bacterium]
MPVVSRFILPEDVSQKPANLGMRSQWTSAHRIDTAFEFTFCAGAIVAAVSRSEWFHKLLAPAFGLLFAVYIALLFARL